MYVVIIYFWGYFSLVHQYVHCRCLFQGVLPSGPPVCALSLSILGGTFLQSTSMCIVVVYFRGYFPPVHQNVRCHYLLWGVLSSGPPVCALSLSILGGTSLRSTSMCIVVVYFRGYFSPVHQNVRCHYLFWGVLSSCPPVCALSLSILGGTSLRSTSMCIVVVYFRGYFPPVHQYVHCRCLF